MMRTSRFAVLGIILLASRGTAEAPAVAPFSLPDAAGKRVSPLGVKNEKATVIVFIGTQCPVNNACMARLAELHGEFKNKGVAFFAINSNQNDTAEDVAAHAKKYEIPFAVLKDDRNVVADKFGARRVPEAFLLDAAGKIVYRGRIDDQVGITFRRPMPTRRDLAEAISELLAGKPVSVPETEPVGCLISRVPARPKPAKVTVTYTGQVAAILERRCVSCHREGQIGPMSLRTFESASAWSGPIEEAVNDNRMPPWHAGPNFGPFANDRRLTPDEKKTLLSWIEQGCSRGEGQAPVGRAFVESWTIGKPDAVIEMSREIEVPAKGPARGIPYLYSTVETNFTEDKWIQAAQIRPGARDVLHHVIVYVMPPGRRRERGEDGIGNGFLVAYAPGDMPFSCPPGSAKKIPKGSRLIFQLHYTPNGRAQTDRSAVGLIFAPEPPGQEVKTRAIAHKLEIPPGAEDHRVDSATTFRQDTLLLSMSPHMHLRGKDFEYRAVFPDGKTQTLLQVPRYDFSWQTTYRLEKPILLPAGTRIECTAHYDNSAKNPNNPDPTKTVRWGDQTWEEMMIGFVDYVTLGEGK